MKAIIRPITPKETYLVRHPVLRAGRPIEDCFMDGDTVKGTLHLGSFNGDELVGVATFVLDAHFHFKGKQYRLRGMAVLPEHRKKGIGEHLLRHGEKLLLEQGMNALWFNAREVALSFYRNLGFLALGEPYEIEPIGTHYLMYKTYL